MKYKIFKCFINNLERPDLYSFFKFSTTSLNNQINYFEHTAKIDIPVNKNQAYFFGSKFSESKDMSLENELDVLTRFSSLYSDLEISYIPHRDETEIKLKKIERLGFHIKRLFKPAEIYFDETKVMPEYVISYYSTVLYSSFIRFNNVKIISINVRDKLNHTHSNINSKYIYKFYDDIGIPVLSV
jgi:hypothetical protein